MGTYRCVGTASCFSLFYPRETTFMTSCSLSLDNIAFEEWVHRQKKIIPCGRVPYFFGYKTGFFSFQNNPKVLDPSCKTDLELWHCLERVELVL